MANVTNLTQQQIEKIQIDEGVIFLNYGLETEKLLAPTRGGGEFGATVTVRDIEFDGKNGKTAGLQAIEEQGATLKVVSLCMSQEQLALAIPNCSITGSGAAAVLKNPKSGIIPASAYLENVTMFAKLIDGKFKKITIYNAMHESGFTAKAVQKAEGELSLEFNAHYTTSDLDGDLWEVKEIDSFRAPVLVSAVTSSATKIALTFNNDMSATGLVAGDFTVLMSDASKAVSAVALNGTNAKIVELTVASLTAGKTVTVAYTKGTAKNTSGVALATFGNTSVTNTLS